jgi:hypothetical protein
VSRHPWTYVAGHRKKPHVHPLATPSGRVLTRVEPADHPWHRALWFTIKYVDGDNFWEEAPPYGVLRHVDDETITWIRPDRETVAITEHRRLTSGDIDDGAYALDWDTTLVPAADAVLDRTEFTTWGGYGGLSLRGRADWTDTRLLLSDDPAPQERVIGRPGRWLDLTGTVDGGTAGVAVLDHPANPRHPVPWYASTRAATYGDEGWSNFLNAAFLFHEPMEVAGGEPLRLRYRLVVHDGDAGAEEVERWWSDWAPA